MRRAIVSKILAGCLLSILFVLSPSADPNDYFKIRVVDEETGRGVPLIELKTVNEVPFYTDSNGIVAFNEPGLMGIDVYFFVSGHGYSYPKDSFGMNGLRLHPVAGKEAVIRVKRENLAERLYRITGQGIYRDSILTGEPVPTKNPALNGKVMGQDSTLRIIYKGKIHWFWGDTGRPSYPLGNFKMSGATSELPENGGLPPEKGIDLEYFVNEDGFSRPMSPNKESGLMWDDGFVIVPDESGVERLVGHYSHMQSLEKMLEHGLVIYDDESDEFKHLVTFDLDKKAHAPRAHPVRVTVAGVDYFYFPTPYPTVRVKADFKTLQDQSNYEAFTCLKEGASFDGEDTELDLKDGKAVYSWKTGTDPLTPVQEKELVEAGVLREEDAMFLPRDINGGAPVTMHFGSVNWNDYRKKWIMIGVEIGGSSLLGEVWYTESDELTGPWTKAQKVVTHDQYTFYNPVHHPFFDQQGGRLIYFEGTYAKTFSGNPISTPRYDYNQIMYRLDLAKLDIDALEGD